MAKINWTMQDIVKPEDLNHLGEEINEVVDVANEAETPAGAQAKANAAEQNAKEYTDTAIGEIDIPAPPVANVFGRKGNIVATVGDYNADQITETNINKIMTNVERTKLAGIETGAQVNEVISVNSKTGAVELDKRDVGLPNVDNVKQATKTEFDAHTGRTDNPHEVTKAQVGLSNVPNYGAASQAQAEAGTDNGTVMTPLRTKQAMEKQAPIRVIDGQFQYYNGTEWVGVGGDPTLSNYFGQYGTFPFAGDQDVTISSNTTWSDAAGYRKVKKLTINAGVTLRIDNTPFCIFADEIELKSSTSIIDASANDNYYLIDDELVNHTSGTMTVVTVNGVSKPIIAGAGGGLVFIVCNNIIGDGKIRANGGNALLADDEMPASRYARYSEGAFSPKKNISGDIGGKEYSGLNQLSNGGAFLLHPIAHLLSYGSEGGNIGNIAIKRFAGGGAASFGIGGASGIGGGGGGENWKPVRGGSASSLITPVALLELYKYGCRGGGGGATHSSGNAAVAGGGGGGGIGVFAKIIAGSLQLEANGGLGTDHDNIPRESCAGGAGKTHVVLI